MSQSQNWESQEQPAPARNRRAWSRRPPTSGKAKNAGKTLWRCLPICRISSGRYLAILLTIVALLCNIAGTYMLKPLITVLAPV